MGDLGDKPLLPAVSSTRERVILRLTVLLLLCYIVWTNAQHQTSFSFDAVMSSNATHANTTKTTTKTTTTTTSPVEYQPAALEAYVHSHLQELGYNTTHGQFGAGCTIWRDNNTHPELYNNLHAFRNELLQYTQKVAAFPALGHDLRQNLTNDKAAQERLCRAVELHPDGLAGLFPSGQLSYSKVGGYSEPLFPPLRHPDFCVGQRPWRQILNLGYLIHDFGALCRKLKKTSRIVLVDMGASLTFHGDRSSSPALYLTDLFRKFGFWFDHIYAYEATVGDPAIVYSKVPDELLAAYHWYNVPVQFPIADRANPFTTLKANFNQDDLILVKLDVDTPSVEMPLALQLLEDPELAPLIDHFYFEHHVHLAELKGAWGKSIQGSLSDTLQLFYAMREQGVVSHYWV